MRLKRILIRTVLTLSLSICVAILLRGWLYRHMITYRSVGTRDSYVAKDNKLIALMNDRPKTEDADIKAIIGQALAVTSGQLTFSANKSDIDPNKLINSGKTHCVGYAAFFATACNSLLKKNDMADIWFTRTRIGQLYLFGVNIHSYFDTPFFKDHDFVTIENKITGEVLAVDPTVSDYLDISFVTYLKNE